MKTILSLIISAVLVVSSFGQTRNVLVGTNNVVVQPTNFWSADVTNARSGLGLGSAATNAASAFQPASSVLSNLVSGGALTFSNITIGITNVTGLQTSLDGKLGTNPTLLIANISNLQTTLDGKLGTNPTLQISNIAALQTALDGKLSGSFPIAISNVSGLQTSLDGKLATNPTLAIANITGLQTNLDSKLSLTGNAVNLTNFPSSLLRTDGSAASLTNFPSSLLRTTGDASGLTNFPTLNQNTTGTASNVTGIVAITNGGSGANTASGARTALGLGTAATNPASAFQPSSSVLTNLAASNGGGLTNINASNVTGTIAISNGGSGATTAGGARTNLGLILPALTNTNVTNFRTAIELGATNSVTFNSVQFGNDTTNDVVTVVDKQGLFLESDQTNTGTAAINFQGDASSKMAANTRANLGLGWTALTNSNAGTGLVSVNTNGEVVSPTNFWQVAPISTTVQYQTNVVSTSTNAATNSRNLFLYSLATSVSEITNTITLPTNPATTFEGDRATIIHGASTTNAVTAVRQLGAATNIITLNQYEEAVLFIYRSGAWGLVDNISYVEPIYFSGTNAAANAATSRTNLGLGATWLTNTNVTNFRSDIGLPLTALTNTDNVNFRSDIGLPLAALTNTNNANFRSSIGLGWSALTNTNAATSLLGYTTNGQVVANTGTNVLTFTNPILFSGTANLTGQGGATTVDFLTFRGANFEVINAGATTNKIFNGTYDGTNYLLTIQAVGTNVAVFRPAATELLVPLQFNNTTNAATTRTNLGLGATWLTNTNVTNFRTAIDLGWAALTNTNSSVGLIGFTTNGGIVIANTNTNAITITNPIVLSGAADITSPISRGATLGYFSMSGNTNTNTWALSYDGNNYFSAFSHNGSQLIRLTSSNINYSVPVSFATNTASEATRTNLGLGLPALTNTNNANFRNAIELGATNNVSFSNVTASGTLTATGTVTATTNLVVNGFVDFSTNHTNSNPATNNHVQRWLQIRIGTNAFFLPLYQ
jgi:hypothetical protein